MKKLAITAIVLASLAIVGEAFIFATQKKDDSDDLYRKSLRADYHIYAPVLPDTLSFAGERVPKNI